MGHLIKPKVTRLLIAVRHLLRGKVQSPRATSDRGPVLINIILTPVISRIDGHGGRSWPNRQADVESRLLVRVQTHERRPYTRPFTADESRLLTDRASRSPRAALRGPCPLHRGRTAVLSGPRVSWRPDLLDPTVPVPQPRGKPWKPATPA